MRRRSSRRRRRRRRRSRRGRGGGGGGGGGGRGGGFCCSLAYSPSYVGYQLGEHLLLVFYAPRWKYVVEEEQGEPEEKVPKQGEKEKEEERRIECV
ncbi:hypothetical protein M0802_003896 [Mischocyttarus mexicanus]|nr:hypothetical protein M0802_003896 [Mischocyttarus mexicanus]